MITTYSVYDCEALSVLVRFADSKGVGVLSVEPSVGWVNGFKVVLDDEVEITNRIDLSDFKTGVDPSRTYWQEIVQHVN